jgi:hypothetical protein
MSARTAVSQSNLDGSVASWKRVPFLNDVLAGEMQPALAHITT